MYEIVTIWIFNDCKNMPKHTFPYERSYLLEGLLPAKTAELMMATAPLPETTSTMLWLRMQ